MPNLNRANIEHSLESLSALDHDAAFAGASLRIVNNEPEVIDAGAQAADIDAVSRQGVAIDDVVILKRFLARAVMELQRKAIFALGIDRPGKVQVQAIRVQLVGEAAQPRAAVITRFELVRFVQRPAGNIGLEIQINRRVV